MSLKEVIISGITLLLGALAVFSGVETGISASTGVLLVLYVGFFAFSSLFISRAFLGSLTTVIPALLAVFFLPQSPWIISGIVISALLIAWGRWQIRKEAMSLPDFSVRKPLRSGLAIALTGIAILISIFYFAAYNDTVTPRFISRKAFDVIFPYIARNIPLLMPGTPEINPNATVDEFIRAYIRETAGEGAMDALGREGLERLVREQRQVFSREFGLTLNGSETVGAVMYEISNRRANEYLGTYTAYLPALLALGVFFALRALFIPLAWIAILFSYCTFHAARRAGILHEESATLTVKRYSL